MRYELTDFEWATIRSFLPNEPRGIPRVDDRRVLNGVFLALAPYLYGAQLDRTVLQQDQAMSACCDPYDKARGQLSGFRQTRINSNLAACYRVHALAMVAGSRS